MNEKCIEDHHETLVIHSERVISVPVGQDEFCSNKISTSKYNWITFLPKNLWYQFQRLANVYFLITAVLQVIPEISVSDGIPSILLPLSLVLAVSGVKDLMEDRKRKKSDTEENSRKCLKMQNSWTETHWENIRVGDILKVNRDQYFPADIVLLTSSEHNGICYVETKNIDGETNLKQKVSMKETYQFFTDEHSFTGVRANVRCEDPNPMIYNFNGFMNINDQLQVAMSSDQFLLRGSSLKNTSWVVGLVVYTGHESKIMLNSSGAKGKFSQMEKNMNKQIIKIFLLQLCLCAISALYYSISLATSNNKSYLELNKSTYDDPAIQFMLLFFTWLLIFNNFVPISLLVTLELVKFFQAIFIEMDLGMYYEPTDTPVEVHSSNLNEEIGQIHYVFSDKTGTLTCNQMEFRKFSIGNQVFGTNERMINKVPNVDFVDLSFDIRKYAHTQFFLLLALCHTVLVEDQEYTASSPDELALINASKYMGVVYLGKDINQVMTVRMPDLSVREYRLLNVLEFNSDRKRMSVIVQIPDGSILLICKGADSMLSTRFAQEQDLSCIEEFGNEGLRTLVISYRVIPEEEYNLWDAEYEEAQKSIFRRAEKSSELAERIEKDLEFAGTTAIEDRLQDGVPETIEKIREAKISLWVLTGDKIETALNIGFSCKLLTPSMTKLSVIGNRTAIVHEELNKAVNFTKDNPYLVFALVISGDALIRAVKEELKDRFLFLIERVRVVLACRVSPQQKAELVELVRSENPEVGTLSIGDGANDVNMILAAHVGIGISGLEGRQAARVSDFSISQFAYLQRLMFVHGRESYRKNANLICYSFYKNILLVMPLFFYGIFSAFSGQMFYNNWIYQLYNMVFTALPIIFYAIFDQEISLEVLEKSPKRYEIGMKNKLFSSWDFWGWNLEAIIMGFVLCIVGVFSVCLYTGNESTGHMNNMWVASFMVQGLVVTLANLKIFMFSYIHFWFTVLLNILSILSYFLTIYILTDILPIQKWLENYESRDSTSQMFENINFYIAFLIIVYFFLIPRPIFNATRKMINACRKKGKTYPLFESTEQSPISAKADETHSNSRIYSDSGSPGKDTTGKGLKINDSRSIRLT